MAETEGAVSAFINFISDSRHKLSKRAALVVILLFGIFFLDNHIGFSEYYDYEHKIDQVIKIESLLQRKDLDTTIRAQLRGLERQIVSRKSWTDYLPSLTALINKAGGVADNQQQRDSTGKIVKREVIRRSFFWHVVTSTWPILLLILIMFLTPFSVNQVNGPLIAGVISLILIFGFIAYGVALLMLQIPVIAGKPVYNYIINSVISTSVIALFLWWSNRFRKRNGAAGSST